MQKRSIWLQDGQMSSPVRAFIPLQAEALLVTLGSSSSVKRFCYSQQSAGAPLPSTGARGATRRVAKR